MSTNLEITDRRPPISLTHDDIVLEARDLTVHYGSRQVIDNVNLSIPRHSVTAVIGSSGCGKSTLLRTFNRMTELIPDTRVEGDVLFNKQSVYAPEIAPEDIRFRIGMVFQRPNPFPKSIFDNVAFGTRINGFKKDIEEIVERSLGEAALWNEVKDRLKDNAYSLSGGQQQRLCIARALAVDPEILLMDEPTSALDPLATYAIEDLISQLSTKRTVLIVTHNFQQAGRVSHQLAYMSINRPGGPGYIVEFGLTHKMFTDPENPKTDAYLKGSIPG